MNLNQRIFIAVLIVAVDLVVFVVPLCALFLAYVIIFRPPAFQDWVRRIYGN